MTWKWSNDTWEFSQDKIIHAFFGFILGVMMPFYLAIIPVFLKEVLDGVRETGTGFSYKDLVLSLGGIVVAVLLTGLL